MRQTRSVAGFAQKYNLLKSIILYKLQEKPIYKANDAIINYKYALFAMLHLGCVHVITQ